MVIESSYFAIIFIFVIILLIIIIIITTIILSVGSEPAPGNKVCMRPSDCATGYTCTFAGVSTTGTCRANKGTVCNVDSDCVNGLICSNGICTNLTNVTATNIPAAGNVRRQNVPYNNGQVGQVAQVNNQQVNNGQVGQVAQVNNQQVEQQNNMPCVNNKAQNYPTIRNNNQDNQRRPTTRQAVNNNMNRNNNVNPNINVNRNVNPNPNVNRNVNPNPNINRNNNINPNVNPNMNRNNNINPNVNCNRNNNNNRNVNPNINRNNNNESFTPISNFFQNNHVSEVSSYDDEINSLDNRMENDMFDIHSSNTTNEYDNKCISRCEREDSYINQCVKNPIDEVLYCSTNEVNIKNAIDVCSYSDYTIFLLDDSSIITEDCNNDKINITNNIKLNRIISFNGYLYGIDNSGVMFTLPNNYFTTTEWIWNKVEWIDYKITHMSTTHDNQYLWLQNNENGYLYDGDNTLLLSLDYCNKRRMYGIDTTHYIDIDTINHNCVVYPEEKIIDNIWDATLSYYNEVIAIHPSQKDKYKRIVVVNWVPYYLKN